MNKQLTPYDLEERTAAFASSAVHMCRKIPEDTVRRPLISQLVRSATSVGANYVEANNASSKRDFANKIFICKKEISETSYWLRLIAADFPDSKTEIAPLLQEARELTFIFQKIVTTLRSPQNKIENLMEIEN